MTTPTLSIIKTMDDWRAAIKVQWSQHTKTIDTLKFGTLYDKLIAYMLLPVIPQDKTQYKAIIKLAATVRYGQHLTDRMKKALQVRSSPNRIDVILKNHFALKSLSDDEQDALDWLLVATGTIEVASDNATSKQQFAKNIVTELRQSQQHSSGVRVQAEMISSGQDVIFVGRDYNIVQKFYKGDKPALRNYLAALRSEWDYPELGSILPGHNPQMLGTIRLHNLYTQVDVWDEERYKGNDLNKLNKLRFKAIEHDMNSARRPVLDAIAAYPRLVITGGPGTGKSSLCRFVATCLAYACDSTAEKQDRIKGLEMLGSGWVHGTILPLYVRLSNFCDDKNNFPANPEAATAKSLLNYLRKISGSFAEHLEAYLLNDETTTQGTLLILDGLDEVYREKDRYIIQRVIENWADMFPNCRILVTSRTYAYRHDAKWRLSERFASAELAPYTGDQIEQYITSWYQQASLLRPALFGGRDAAETYTLQLAQDLLSEIHKTKSLYPLARQPLMLAMLALIHEDNRRLPHKRADLYQQTVELLDRWNIPIADDKLAQKLKKIDLDRVRAALKLAAFDLHKRRARHHSHPTAIAREDLLLTLDTQQRQGEGLGAGIEDVVEYLSTRNGILVSDEINSYRFPHLSIQEYLAACALIELYDECDMPNTLKQPSDGAWTFPENLAALLRADPYRWRNVTLFAGSIVATDTGQDRRWNLIEELLPEKITPTLPDEFIHSIVIASEIWVESWLKARNRLQKLTRAHLRKCLFAIKDDTRLDVLELSSVKDILKKLDEDDD